MKTKNAYKFLPFALLMLVMGCSKKDDAAPDLATGVTGIYFVTSVTISGKTTTISPPTSSYNIFVNRVDNNIVDFQITNGTNKGSATNVPLKGTAGSVTFQATATNGTLVGDIINKDLTYNSVESGVSFTLKATKF